MNPLDFNQGNEITIVAWETDEAKFINMMLAPAHVLRIKIDKPAEKQEERGELNENI